MNTDNRPVDEPLSIRKPGANNAGCGIAFGGLFVLIGLISVCFTFVKPVIRIMAARNWPAVPCTIIGNSIGTHRGKSTTYSFDVLYSYRQGQSEFTSSQYSFTPKSSGSYSSATARAGRYPQGSATVCYVNPNAAGDAVLVRDADSDLLLGLIPLAFALAGGALMFGVWRTTRSDLSPRASWRPKGASSAGAGVSGGTLQTPSPLGGAATTGLSSRSPFDGPFSEIGVARPGGRVREGGANAAAVVAGGRDLQPLTGTPVSRAVGLTLISAFWNGFIWFMVIQFARDTSLGLFKILPFLFFTPFVVIGLFLGVMSVGAILALGNARASLRLDRDSVTPGDSFDVMWSLGHGLFYPRQVRIWMEGREEATYTRGTDTVTDKALFFQSELVPEATGPSGCVRVSIPENLMHSFESQHNKIVYVVSLHGTLPMWPDIQEEFKLVVSPRPPAPPA